MTLSPQKSPPLRKAWRDVAKGAAKDSLTADERCERVCAALFEDLSADVGDEAIKAIQETLETAEKRQFSPEAALREIEALRRTLPPTGFMDSILDHINISLHFGETGEEAFASGMKRAALERASAGNRSVEEWHHRKARSPMGLERSIRLRQNLDGALGAERMSRFGSEVAQRMRGELDAGPEIG